MSGVVSVRPMTEADLDVAGAIGATAMVPPWTRETMAAELGRPGARLFVATDGTQAVVGFSDSYVVLDEWHLLALATATPFRRRGVGTALLAALIASARAEGCRSVLLEVRRSNAAAIALYTRGGFLSVGVRPGYYADGNEDAVLMTLTL